MSDAQVEQRRPLNRIAVAALVCAASGVLFPLAVALGVWALFQIRRRDEEGALFAAMAIISGGIVIPTVLALSVVGHAPFLDGCRTTRKQSIGTLRIIAYLQNRFHDDKGRYGTLEEIRFKLPDDPQRYRYELVFKDESRFTAQAIGTGTMEGDVVVIDQRGKTRVTEDLCAKLNDPASR